MMKCDHDTITADILEGDAPGLCIQWCQRCGSYRRGHFTPRHDLVFDEWREPEGIETEEPEQGWKSSEPNLRGYYSSAKQDAEAWERGLR